MPTDNNEATTTTNNPDTDAFGDAFDEMAASGDTSQAGDEQAVAATTGEFQEDEASAATVVKEDGDEQAKQQLAVDAQKESEMLDYPENERDRNRVKSWEGRLTAREQALKDKEQEIARLQAQVRHSQPTAEQQATRRQDTKKTGPDDAVDLKAIAGDDPELAGFLEEYSDFAGPLQKLIGKAVGSAVNPLTQQFEQTVAPIRQTIAKSEEEKHFNAIVSKHADFNEIVSGGSLQKFIDEQPAFIRPAMQRVYDVGTTGDVIDLIDRFKEASGLNSRTTNSQGNNTGRYTPRGPQAVPIKRGGQRVSGKGVDKDDFDGAFDEFAKS